MNLDKLEFMVQYDPALEIAITYENLRIVQTQFFYQIANICVYLGAQ
jgi:hypothetical protein